MTFRLIIRGFAAGKLQFEEHVELDHLEFEKLLPDLAEKHAEALADHSLHMIEIEFLDDPDQQERFFRIGTDPSAMVRPLRVI